MKKKYIAEYESIAKIDEPHYLALWKWFSMRGDKIPNGSEVELTDWAKENGIENKNGKFIKVRNHRNPYSIVVQKEGRKSVCSYWSGFWKKKS